MPRERLKRRIGEGTTKVHQAACHFHFKMQPDLTCLSNLITSIHHHHHRPPTPASLVDEAAGPNGRCRTTARKRKDLRAMSLQAAFCIGHRPKQASQPADFSSRSRASGSRFLCSRITVTRTPLDAPRRPGPGWFAGPHTDTLNQPNFPRSHRGLQCRTCNHQLAKATCTPLSAEDVQVKKPRLHDE